MKRIFVSTLAAVGILALSSTPGLTALNDEQPKNNAEAFLIRHPYTNVKEKGVRTQASGLTIPQLQDLQRSLRNRP